MSKSSPPLPVDGMGLSRCDEGSQTKISLDFGWVLNPVTGIFVKEKRLVFETRRRDTGGRATTEAGNERYSCKSRIARSAISWKEPALEPLEGAQPSQSLDFGLLGSRKEKMNFCFPKLQSFWSFALAVLGN